MKHGSLNVTILAIAFSFLLLNVPSLSAETNAFAIPGTSAQACLVRVPSNLLVSVSARTKGKVLSFTRELTPIRVKIKRAKSDIARLKGRKDARSKSNLKKLSKKLSALIVLRDGIVACRDGRFIQSLSVNCASSGVQNGATCDDGNPCTLNDRCANSQCIGDLAPTSTLNCAASSCAKSVVQCNNGVFVSCFVGANGSEICNGIDDDCNGEVDDKSICATPTPTLAITPPPTAKPTISPSPKPTANSCSAAPTPFTCIAPKIPGNNNNPDGCRCKTNGDCIGNCTCGAGCHLPGAPPCPSGTTCITDTTQSNVGSCSGVCPDSPFNFCTGGNTTTPICIPNNGGNLSARCCSCVINGDCQGDCVAGVCT